MQNKKKIQKYPSIVLKSVESEYYDHKNHLKVIEVLLKECPVSKKLLLNLSEK